MKLPYAERAEVSIRKLQDYCLSTQHDEGKHKARVFASALGMTVDDAEALRELLLQAAQNGEAQPRFRDAYGQRYVVDFPATWQGKSAIIRSAWILEHGSQTPRLTSCFVL